MKRRSVKALKRQSVKASLSPHAPTLRRSHAPTLPPRAFTLIELMVVVAIMAIVMTIAIPTIYQQLHPDSMRKAVSDVLEACAQARARAILDGTPADLVIRPGDRQFDVVLGVAAPSASAPEENQLFSPDVAGNDWRRAPKPTPNKGGGGAFSAKLSEKIFIEDLGVNGDDNTDDEVVHVHFSPNGVSDELEILLRAENGERRLITLEVATGLADVETDLKKMPRR